MGIHARFGENLRNLCFQYATIAEVCDGIGINRQQFNKYLSGQHLPNSRTLGRICGFLGISEEALFSSAAPKGTHAIDPRPSASAPQDSGLARIAAEFRLASGGSLDSCATMLLPGLYYCYFPLHGHPEFLMRSLVSVKKIQDGLAFTRMTVFRSQNRGRKYLFRGRHRGIVMANHHEIYMLGLNQQTPHQLSFMSFERANAGALPVLTGLAITRIATESISSRVCLQYIFDYRNIRGLLNSLGPVAALSSSVDSFVRSSLLTDRTTNSNQLRVVGFDEALVRALGLSAPAEQRFVTAA